eukprot:10835379-Alexandrium_andersonii.AAC.1
MVVLMRKVTVSRLPFAVEKSTGASPRWPQFARPWWPPWRTSPKATKAPPFRTSARSPGGGHS